MIHFFCTTFSGLQFREFLENGGPSSSPKQKKEKAAPAAAVASTSRSKGASAKPKAASSTTSKHTRNVSAATNKKANITMQGWLSKMNRKGKFQDRFFTITTQAEFAYYKSESTDEETCKPPVSLLTLTEVRIPSTDPLAPKYAVDKTCFDLQFAGGKTMVLSELPTDMGSRAIGRTLRALATQEGRVAIATRAMGGPVLPKIAAAAAQKMTEFPSQAQKGRTVRAEAAASTRMVAGLPEKGKKKKKLTAMERMALLSGKSAASPTPSPRVATNGNEKEKKLTASNSEKIKSEMTKVKMKVTSASKHRRSITAPLVLKAAAKKASGTPKKNSKMMAAAAKASTEEEVAKKKTTTTTATRTKKKKKKHVGSVAPEKQKKKKKPLKAAPPKATMGASVAALPRVSNIFIYLYIGMTEYLTNIMHLLNDY